MSGKNEIRELLDARGPSPRARQQREHREQTMAVDWMRRRGIAFFSVPNGAILGGRNRYAVLNYLKAEGLTNGAPDLVIIDHPPAHPKHHVMVEMKNLDGGLRSDEQRALHDRAWAQKWIVLVPSGFADFVERMKALGWR